MKNHWKYIIHANAPLDKLYDSFKDYRDLTVLDQILDVTQEQDGRHLWTVKIGNQRYSYHAELAEKIDEKGYKMLTWSSDNNGGQYGGRLTFLPDTPDSSMTRIRMILTYPGDPVLSMADDDEPPPSTANADVQVAASGTGNPRSVVHILWGRVPPPPI
jgi:uncharacterized membrane protein